MLNGVTLGRVLFDHLRERDSSRYLGFITMLFWVGEEKVSLISVVKIGQLKVYFKNFSYERNHTIIKTS